VRYPAPGERILAEEMSPMKELSESPICNLVGLRAPKARVTARALESPTESEIKMTSIGAKYKLQEINCQVSKVRSGWSDISIAPPAPVLPESLSVSCDTSKLSPVVP